MSVIKTTVLPTEEELTVTELRLSSSTLRTASFHLGKFCEAQNNEFLLCRYEELDPRYCLDEGKAVTACALDFFRKLKKNCREEFNAHAKCIDNSRSANYFSDCRDNQAVYDKCVLDKMNIERPPFGYFCEVKVVDTKRPPPKRLPTPEFKDLPKKRTKEDPPIGPVFDEDYGALPY